MSAQFACSNSSKEIRYEWNRRLNLTKWSNYLDVSMSFTLTVLNRGYGKKISAQNVAHQLILMTITKVLSLDKEQFDCEFFNK